MRVAIVATIGGAVLAYLVWHPPVISSVNQDFSAFYCAARVLSQGADPYRYGPLRTCELPVAAYVAATNAVVPDPRPPYAIAVFIPLSKLDYVRASFLWSLVILAAGVVVVWTVTRFTSLSPLLVALCTLPALWIAPLQNGASATVVIAFLCAAAAAAVANRNVLAAVLIGFASIEPHVALPAALSLVIFRPATRLPLVVTGLVIVVISIVSAGAFINAEYIQQVLPAHAASEIGSRYQYSLSSVLYFFGVPQGSALLAGALQYGLFVVAGILVANSLRQELPAVVVLAPVAFAVGGGTFVHLGQIVAAIPFGLLLASRFHSIAAWLGVVLLDIPWMSFVEWLNFKLQWQLIFIPVPSRAPDSALAEVVWGPYMNGASQHTPLWWLEHVPVYLGLALIYLSALKAVRRRRQPGLNPARS
jgi:hypothetical protein